MAAPGITSSKKISSIVFVIPRPTGSWRCCIELAPNAATRFDVACARSLVRQRGVSSAICEGLGMIIQTAPAGQPRLAVMMYEHTALSHQFARAFGNDRFQGPEPNDLMFHVVLHHDAGWAEFDRDPVTDRATGLPYNLVETPAEYIAVTSRGSPEFNQQQHPFCGLMSSMHSWGLYNGRYGLSSVVLIDKIPPQDRPIAQKMLDGELVR